MEDLMTLLLLELIPIGNTCCALHIMESPEELPLMESYLTDSLKYMSRKRVLFWYIHISVHKCFK